jgi:hypothetical protein
VTSFNLLLSFVRKKGFYMVVVNERATTEFIWSVDNHAASILPPLSVSSAQYIRYRFLNMFFSSNDTENFLIKTLFDMDMLHVDARVFTSKSKN